MLSVIDILSIILYIIVSHKPYKAGYQIHFNCDTLYITEYFICDTLINHYLLTYFTYKL